MPFLTWIKLIVYACLCVCRESKHEIIIWVQWTQEDRGHFRKPEILRDGRHLCCRFSIGPLFRATGESRQKSRVKADSEHLSLVVSLRYIHGLKKKVEVLVTQSYWTLYDPMDCSPLVFSVHGILQAKILEWVAISFFRGSFQPRDQTNVSCIAGRFFTVWATRKTPHTRCRSLLSRVKTLNAFCSLTED